MKRIRASLGKPQGNRKTSEDAVKDMQAATEWLIEKGGASTDDGLAELLPIYECSGLLSVVGF